MPNQEESGKKKMMRVALSVTGATAAGAGLMMPTPAKAATDYYQIAVAALQSVYRVQICGYNQNNTWVCTGNSIPHVSYKGARYYIMKNWWWRGHIKLWWNGHGPGSWNQCSVPANYIGSSFPTGFFMTGREVHLTAGSGRPEC